MGLTKTQIFSAEQNELAQIAKVLGHPARLAILQHLVRVNTCICGDLVSEIGLAQPTISQHLKELKKVKLIKGTIEGTRLCYCLDSITINKISTLFASLFESIAGKKTGCC